MNLEVKLVKDGVMPTQGYKGDVAHDTYVRESRFIVGGSLSSTKLPLGISTSFDHEKYAVLVSPRGSFSKLPLALANSVGLVEGTYRGEYLALVRAHLIASGTTSKVLTLNADGDVIAEDLKEALESIPDAKEAVAVARAQFLKDTPIMDQLVGREIPADIIEILFEDLVPTGTVLIKKNTRLVQVWAVPKETIDLVPTETLSESERGTGAVGSSGLSKKGDK